MGLLGRKGEAGSDLKKELEAMKLFLADRLEERVTNIEQALANLKEDVHTVIQNTSSPMEVVSRVEDLIGKANELYAGLASLKDQAEQFGSIKDGLMEIIEALERERRVVNEDIKRFEAERATLQQLKREVEQWRVDLEKKEEEITQAQRTLSELRTTKENLEKEIRELSATYLNSFEETRIRLDEEIRKIDKIFKLREIRLERLIRKENELNQKLAMLDDQVSTSKRLEAQLAEMREEVTKLESSKEKLQSEISELEARRSKLEEIVAEIRRAILSP